VIYGIFDRPREPAATKPAWRVLTIALVPSLISQILGSWGTTLGDPIKKAFGALFGGG
jgi:hypothetical protein